MINQIRGKCRQNSKKKSCEDIPEKHRDTNCGDGNHITFLASVLLITSEERTAYFTMLTKKDEVRNLATGG